MRTYELKIREKDYQIKVKSFSLDTAELEINGEVIKVDVKTVGDDMAGRPPVRPMPSAPASSKASTQPAAKPAAGSDGDVGAPIPGAIMEVFVKEGDVVKAGQPVVKMEAMKMENIINAHKEGTVVSIHVRNGDAVSQGQALVTIG